VHAPTEDKSDYTKNNFYEEQECVINQVPMHSMKIVLGHIQNSGQETSTEWGDVGDLEIGQRIINKTDLQETGHESVDGVEMAQDVVQW
jgi:hypothetical protein